MQQRVIGMMGLQDHRTRAFGTPGATRDLHDQLAEPLTGAEIDAVQPLIDSSDNDQGQVWQIMALGQHLCADEDARPGTIESLKDRIAAGPAARAVAIDAQHRHLRKMLLEDFLETFGALTLGCQCGTRALGAGRRHARHSGTMMAAQAGCITMQGQRPIATRALRAPAAGMTEQHRRIAATIAEHQHLFATTDTGLDGIQGRDRQTLIESLATQIHDLQRRRPGDTGPLAEAQQAVTVRLRIRQAFQRRCRRTENQRHAE